jgi:hypothetical protein
MMEIEDDLYAGGSMEFSDSEGECESDDDLVSYDSDEDVDFRTEEYISHLLQSVDEYEEDRLTFHSGFRQTGLLEYFPRIDYENYIRSVFGLNRKPDLGVESHARDVVGSMDTCARGGHNE